MHENEPIKFDVRVFGEPAPDVSWSVNGKVVHQTTYRRIENVPNNTKFFNDRPERKDTGTYKISASNQYGSDTAEVEVTVVCEFQYFRYFTNTIQSSIDDSKQLIFLIQLNLISQKGHWKYLMFTKMVAR